MRAGLKTANGNVSPKSAGLAPESLLCVWLQRQGCRLELVNSARGACAFALVCTLHGTGDGGRQECTRREARPAIKNGALALRPAQRSAAVVLPEDRQTEPLPPCRPHCAATPRAVRTNTSRVACAHAAAWAGAR